MKIIFLHVKDAESKINKICSTIKKHFDQREKILITVHDEAAAQYLDQLLWKFPPHSFLPHLMTNHSSKEAVLITTALKNLNEASLLINLTGSCSPILSLFHTIYELFDHTTPTKKAQSEQRLATYQNAGYLIVNETI